MDRSSPEISSKKNPFHAYREYISSLNLSSPTEKKTRGDKIKNFLVKLIFVFIGSLLTTFTFNLLIDPNGLYNSGLNGLIQTGLKIAAGHNYVDTEKFYLYYYLTSLAINV